MRLKYTSFKSLTLKKRKKKRKKKSIANAFVLGPAYELYYSLKEDTTLCPASKCPRRHFVKRSVYWVKNGKIKKRGGEGEKKMKEEAFVSSTQLTT